MAKYDYAEDKRAAEEAISDYGVAAILRKPGASTGDPWNPVAGGTTDHTVKVVVTDYSEVERDGTLIQQTDKKALLVGADATDQDVLIIEGEAYEIVKVLPLKPGDTVIYQEVQIRR